jgi:1-acyl-sn-glycerol-3-phosphate acyltransferase
VRIGLLGWALFGLRFVLLAITIFGLMGPMLLLRLAGKIHAAQTLVQFACRVSLWVVGVRVKRRGRPMRHAGAVVANHSSWLDIFSLNAVQKVLFVSKAEVQHWPLIGVISRSTGTVFIERKQTHAAKHKGIFQTRLLQGHRLLFFPEGTSTDGRRVLPFRSSLFAAFFEEELRESMWIQPVSLIYVAPIGRDVRFYGWWGDEDFVPHFIKILAQTRQGRIEVVFHEPLDVAEVSNRKEMARLAQEVVRSGLLDAL